MSLGRRRWTRGLGGDLGPGVVEACVEEAMGRAPIVCALALRLVSGTCGCTEFRRTPSVP